MTSQPIKKTVSNSASINGVDTDALRQTIEAVKKNKGIAKFKFKATNKWIHGGHNRTTINEFYGAEQNHTRSNPYDLDADEPPVLLGEDQGANPVEYVLTALSACLTTSLVYHAAARGIRIDEVESHLEGDLDLRGFLGLSDQIRKGYQNIRVRFKIKSDAEKAQLEELCQYSPVYDIVSNPVPVSIEMEMK